MTRRLAPSRAAPLLAAAREASLAATRGAPSSWSDEATLLMLYLRDVEGWTARDVAAALGVTRNAVLGLYHRVWTQTRRDFPEEAGDGAEEPGWWARRYRVEPADVPALVRLGVPEERARGLSSVSSIAAAGLPPVRSPRDPGGGCCGAPGTPQPSTME